MSLSNLFIVLSFSVLYQSFRPMTLFSLFCASFIKKQNEVAMNYDGPDMTLFIYTLMSVKQKELV